MTTKQIRTKFFLPSDIKPAFGSGWGDTSKAVRCSLPVQSVPEDLSAEPIASHATNESSSHH